LIWKNIIKNISKNLKCSGARNRYVEKPLVHFKIWNIPRQYGKPFHGMGIKVRVNEKDIGYRPVTDDVSELFCF
jgi:hypothetical protein